MYGMPWVDLHADMIRMQERMDRMFANGFHSIYAIPDVVLQSVGSRMTL